MSWLAWLCASAFAVDSTCPNPLWHDGGDGVCVPPDHCSDGYLPGADGICTAGWSPVGSLFGPRASAEVVQTKGGRALIIGGWNGGGMSLSSTEVFDVVIDAWRPVGNLVHGRRGHVAVALDDGGVLVAGGLDTFGGRVLDGVEVWSPATQDWSVVGAMHISRLAPGGTLLPDGSVLVSGGRGEDEVVLASAERVSASGESRLAASMPDPRWGHASIALRDGRVAVLGGEGPGHLALSSVVIYDPKTDAWVDGPPLGAARAWPEAVRLADGRVLLAGGIGPGGSPAASAEIWTPNGSTPTSLPTPTVVDAMAVATNGDVIAIGGTDALRYDGSGWTVLPPLPEARTDSALVALPDGIVLAVGGFASKHDATDASFAFRAAPVRHAKRLDDTVGLLP